MSEPQDEWTSWIEMETIRDPMSPRLVIATLLAALVVVAAAIALVALVHL